MTDDWNIKDEIIDFSVVKEVAIKIKKKHPEQTEVYIPVILADSLKTLHQKIIEIIEELASDERQKRTFINKIDKLFGVEELDR